jgi:DNA polymerase-3 subunit gamma/tau
VKFLFATTEVNKVPVTVLSRCQRFDLRRIPADKLAAHFAAVSEAEGVEAEDEALMLIARAAEGSARDGLSILDQAIAHAGIEGDAIRADAVRAMLGLSDRGAIRDLFGLLLSGDAIAALASLRGQYDLGVDPQAVLRTLLETVHGVTLVKLGTEPGAAQSAEELKALERWAAGLSFPMLHRLWQLLLRGHDEVAKAALPIEACEMALLRLIHASQLPDPGELAKQIVSGAPMASAPAPVAPAEPSGPRDMRELVDLLQAKGRLTLAHQVADYLRPIRFEPPEIEFSLARTLPDLSKELSAALREYTGRFWKLVIAESGGEPTLRDALESATAADREAVLASPVVAAAMAAFPDAELIGWSKTGS